MQADAAEALSNDSHPAADTLTAGMPDQTSSADLAIQANATQALPETAGVAAEALMAVSAEDIASSAGFSGVPTPPSTPSEPVMDMEVSTPAHHSSNSPPATQLMESQPATQLIETQAATQLIETQAATQLMETGAESNDMGPAHNRLRSRSRSPPPERPEPAQTFQGPPCDMTEMAEQASDSKETSLQAAHDAGNSRASDV